MTPNHQAIFGATVEHLQDQPHTFGASAGANVLEWFKENGMQLVQVAVQFIPGGAPVAKYVPIVLGFLSVLKDNGVISSDATPAA